MGLMDWTGRSHREREDSLHAIYQMELTRAHDPSTDPRDRAQAMANAELAAQQIFPGALGHQTQPPKHRGGLIGHIQNLLMGPPQQGAGLPQGIGGLGDAASPGTPPGTGQQASEPPANVDQTPNLAASMDDPNENGYMASMGTITPPPPRGALGPLDQTPPAPALPQGTPPPQTGTPARAGGGVPMNAAARQLPTPAPLQQPALQPPNDEGVYTAQGPMGAIRTLDPRRIAAMKAEAENASLNTAMTGNLQRMNRLNEDPLAKKLQAGQQAQMAAGQKISPGQKLAPARERQPVLGSQIIDRFPHDRYGAPTDPSKPYMIGTDPLTDEPIWAEPMAVKGVQGPLQNTGQGFQKPLLNPYNDQQMGAANTIPPPAYATRTTKTSGTHEQAVKQPDNSTLAVPMSRSATTTRSVQVPPTPGSTPMSGGAAGVTTTTPPATAAPPPRSSRSARGGMAATGSGAGRVIGGAAPSDREKTQIQNVQEGIKLGGEIEGMLKSLPAEDLHGGSLDMILQSAKQRMGARTYAAGFNSDQFQRELFSRVRRLKIYAGQGLATGGRTGIMMNQLINEHLPAPQDAPPLILDKLRMMGQGLKDLQESSYQLSPQLQKLIPPAHSSVTEEDGPRPEGYGASTGSTAPSQASTPATDAIKKRLMDRYNLNRK